MTNNTIKIPWRTVMVVVALISGFIAMSGYLSGQVEEAVNSQAFPKAEGETMKTKVAVITERLNTIQGDIKEIKDNAKKERQTQSEMKGILIRIETKLNDG